MELKRYIQDSGGNAVVLIKFQECDLVQALNTVNVDDVLPCCMYTQACLRATIETLDLPFPTNYVIDFESMGMKNYYQAYKLGLTSIFSMLSGHYPETVKTITLLHIPYFFNFCYNGKSRRWTTFPSFIVLLCSRLCHLFDVDCQALFLLELLYRLRWWFSL